MDITTAGAASVTPSENARPSRNRKLASDRVRHVGQSVVAIVAETLDQARDAAELVVCDYDPLPAVIDTAGALTAGAPRVWDEIANNQCFHWEGGDRAATDAAFARAAHVTRTTLINNRVVVNAMEPRGALAVYDPGTRRYTLYTGNQGVHMHRTVIAGILAHEITHAGQPDTPGGKIEDCVNVEAEAYSAQARVWSAFSRWANSRTQLAPALKPSKATRAPGSCRRSPRISCP